ncbi:hypothetical protein Tsubulata_008966 [Turnera subulata]|uniref:HR-like lesion-inducer n=1 Tax=Turnera subulata TaxID=218843 RepID=A0A9Q0FSJ9_9ROSI|nr:hypothetical protein Tsubulata_008966 [Turnera subulata]
MGFLSFVGRVLFASVFILPAWQEFNEYDLDGGPASKALAPKFNAFSKHVGFQVPPFEPKHVIALSVALKGEGGLLFIFGSSYGASLLALNQAILTPILYDFYNYDVEKKEFNLLFTEFTQNLALFGALLYFIGMKNSIPKRQLKEKTP